MLKKELDNVIYRWVKESDVTIAELLGVLRLIEHEHVVATFPEHYQGEN